MTAVRVVDNTDAVKKAVRRAAWKNLAHSAAGLRKVAQFSIKTRATSSDRGQPPHTRQGALRRSILFAVESDSVAVIGPSVTMISDVARAHEHGGPQRPRGVVSASSSTKIAGANWEMYVGGHGPIADPKGEGVVYIKFLSNAQVNKSLDYIDTAPDDAFGNTLKERRRQEKRRIISAVKAAGGWANYPARPFMGPALMENLDRLPAMWANSVR